MCIRSNRPFPINNEIRTGSNRNLLLAGEPRGGCVVGGELMRNAERSIPVASCAVVTITSQHSRSNMLIK